MTRGPLSGEGLTDREGGRISPDNIWEDKKPGHVSGAVRGGGEGEIGGGTHLSLVPTPPLSGTGQIAYVKPLGKKSAVSVVPSFSGCLGTEIT
jgi:hypothetical protein